MFTVFIFGRVRVSLPSLARSLRLPFGRCPQGRQCVRRGSMLLLHRPHCVPSVEAPSTALLVLGEHEPDPFDCLSSRFAPKIACHTMSASVLCALPLALVRLRPSFSLATDRTALSGLTWWWSSRQFLRL